MSDLTKSEDKSKSMALEFMAQLSHEFRTPITAIDGYATLIDEGIVAPREEIPEKVRTYVSRIRESAQVLTRLVNDLNHFYRKMEGSLGDLELNIKKDVPLHYSVAAVVRMCEIEAEKKKLKLEYIELDPSIVVTADEDRVRQVIRNILDNAIKYCTQGHIRIEGGVQDNLAWVSVSDTGMGIAPEDYERIFQEGVRLTSGDGSSGLGYGLGLSRRLARLMSGDLLVESEVGKGSTFKLYLPRYVEADSKPIV